MSELRRLTEVLSEVEELPWNHALYLPFNSKWALDTQCAILDPDDCSDDEENPPLAIQHGLSYALTVQQLQGIRANAAAQLSTLSEEDLLTALLYYYDNDAFIKF